MLMLENETKVFLKFKKSKYMVLIVLKNKIIMLVKANA